MGASWATPGGASPKDARFSGEKRNALRSRCLLPLAPSTRGSTARGRAVAQFLGFRRFGEGSRGSPFPTRRWVLLSTCGLERSPAESLVPLVLCYGFDPGSAAPVRAPEEVLPVAPTLGFRRSSGPPSSVAVVRSTGFLVWFKPPGGVFHLAGVPWSVIVVLAR